SDQIYDHACYRWTVRDQKLLSAMRLCPPWETGVVSYRDGSFPASGTNRLWPKRLLPYSPISRWVSGVTRKSASALPPTTLMRDAFFGLSSNTWYTLYSRESPSTLGKSCSLSRHVSEVARSVSESPCLS